MNEDDFVQSPSEEWTTRFGVPQLSGGVTHAPATCLRFVAKASKAHEVSDGEPKQAGARAPDLTAERDARMMRAAIK